MRWEDIPASDPGSRAGWKREKTGRSGSSRPIARNNTVLRVQQTRIMIAFIPRRWHTARSFIIRRFSASDCDDCSQRRTSAGPGSQRNEAGERDGRRSRWELIGPTEATVYKVHDIYRKFYNLKKKNYDILIRNKRSAGGKSPGAVLEWKGDDPV